MSLRADVPGHAIRIFVSLMIAGILGSGSVADAGSFRVVNVTNRPDPKVYKGECPATITFVGTIETDGPGEVRYTWIRSDRAKGPVETLYFENAGTQTVRTTWSLTPRPDESVWEVLQILSPNRDATKRLGKAIPKILCRQGRGSPPASAADSDRSREETGSMTLRVGCPADAITAEVTNRLPESWWSTPQGIDLRRLEISTVAEKPVLVCVYGKRDGRFLVDIIREFPPGYSTCEAREDHFFCRK